MKVEIGMVEFVVPSCVCDVFLGTAWMLYSSPPRISKTTNVACLSVLLLVVVDSLGIVYVTVYCKWYGFGGSVDVVGHLAQHPIEPNGGVTFLHQHSMQGFNPSEGTPVVLIT